MDIRLSIPDKARDKLKKAADKRFLTMQAYVRTIVAKELNKLE